MFGPDASVPVSMLSVHWLMSFSIGSLVMCWQYLCYGLMLLVPTMMLFLWYHHRFHSRNLMLLRFHFVETFFIIFWKSRKIKQTIRVNFPLFQSANSNKWHGFAHNFSFAKRQKPNYKEPQAKEIHLINQSEPTRPLVTICNNLLNQHCWYTMDKWVKWIQQPGACIITLECAHEIYGWKLAKLEWIENVFTTHIILMRYNAKLSSSIKLL